MSSQDSTPGNLRESSKRLYESVPFSNPPKQIRVLDLEAVPNLYASSTSFLHAPVKGQLRVVDLDSEPTFFALSYVWGNFSSPPATITCNGRQIEVTPNCLSALRHVAKIHGPMTVWVDALCIQQDNGREKHHQIALMGDIYAKAKSVLIWLGQGNQCIDRAMYFIATGGGLPRVADLPIGDQDATMSRSSCIQPTDDLEILTGPQLEKYYPKALLLQHLILPFRPNLDTGLKDFFTRPWIGRIWTLQEMVLARDARLICGQKSVPMLALVYALDALELKECYELFDLPPQVQSWRRLMQLWKGQQQFDESLTRFEAHKTDLRAAMDKYTKLRKEVNKRLTISATLALRIARVWSAFIPMTMIVWPVLFVAGLRGYQRYSYIKAGRTQRSTLGLTYSVSLADCILTEFQERQSRFGRDRYFAIRSFLGSSADLDYDATSDELVYQHMAQSIAESTESLDMSLLTSWDPRRHGPSWVPNWENLPRWWIKLVKFHQQGPVHQSSAAAPPEGSENVQASHLAQWSFIGSDGLRIRGISLSTIPWASHEIEPAMGTETAIERAFRLCIMLRDSHISEAFLKDFDSLAFRDATNVYRLIWLSRNMDRLNLDDVESFAKSLPSTVRPREEGGKRIPNEYRRNTAANIMSMASVEVARDLEDLFDYLQEQYLSLVHVMDYGAGYAAIGSEVGDLVAILAGVRLPVVLRPQPQLGSFRIIGPVYIPAVSKNSDPWRVEGEEFVLV